MKTYIDVQVTYNTAGEMRPDAFRVEENGERQTYKIIEILQRKETQHPLSLAFLCVYIADRQRRQVMLYFDILGHRWFICISSQ